MASSSINLTNQFLIAMPGMGDGTFAGTVVYLCEHTENGALGLVINKPIDITLRNLFEKVELSLDRDDIAELPVYFGGPVQTERGFVLHEAPRRRRRGERLQLVPDDPRRPRDDDHQGRARGDLQRRRAEEDAGHARLQRLGRRASSRRSSADNGWINVEADRGIIFDTPVEQRYDKALSLLGIDAGMLSSDAGHA